MTGSPEQPRYFKFRHDENWATPMYGVCCDEGWRQSVVCAQMYEWAADWLISQIQGRPYASDERLRDIAYVLEKRD